MIHVHVDGEGYMRFARGEQAVYASDAVLTTSSGVLATRDGYPMLPQIHVPADGTGLKIGMDGTVTVSGKAVGRVVLASFGGASPQKVGGYITSSSRSSIGYPGEGVLGILRCGGEASIVAQPQGATSQPRTGQVRSAASQRGRPQSDQPLTIEVRLHNEIDKPEILLGDVADFNGADPNQRLISGLSLGVTPLVGSVRGLTRSFIIASLRSEGVDTGKLEVICPTGATVERKSQKIDGADLVDAAKAGAKTLLSFDLPARVNRNVPDLLAPSGELKIFARDAQATSEGATVSLEIDVDGKLFSHRSITLVSSVPVVSIRAGDPVKIKMWKNGASVEISGRAHSAGRVGAAITVDTDTDTTLTGLLIAPGLVEVKL